MFYAIDSKKHVYAFITKEARNAFVWDCVTTDAYAMARAEAIEKMRRYCLNRAAHKTAEEFAKTREWAHSASEADIVEKYASYFE